MIAFVRIACALVMACAAAPAVAHAQDSRPIETRGVIPVDSMKSATGMIYFGGAVELRPDGRMGLADFPVVTRVDSGSVSWRGGLRAGDVLLSVNGRDTRDARPFRRERGETGWRVRIRRDAQEEEIVIEFPASS